MGRLNALGAVRRVLSPAANQFVWVSDQGFTVNPAFPGGVIAIDVDRHPRLYDAIRDRIGERSSLCADVNDNRRLDDGECDDENWLGQGLAGLD